MYADLLAERIRRHGATVWLVNTGWIGGPYGVGERMELGHTRAIIDAIHDGSLAQAETVTEPVFGLAVPTSCPGVPDELLMPESTWSDPAAYREAAADLAARFEANFEAYRSGVEPEVVAAGLRAA